MLALVTGASSGIGKAFSYILSNKYGYDLILVARSEDKMEKIKKDLKTNITIITLDLLDTQNVYKLYDIVHKQNIDLLINNAGFGLFGEFSKTDLNRELEMIDLNIKAYHILTKLFLQDFLKKDKGYILNVCSSAGFMAGPNMATYYATKNYITKLTMAINEELRQNKSHVQVSALCPGPVATNFNKVAHGSFALKEASAEDIAFYALKKLWQRKMLIVPKLGMKITLFMQRFAPYRLQLIIAYHIQYRKEHGKKVN